MLNTDAINEFTEIYERYTSLRLTEEEAIEKANEIFALYKVVCKPVLDERDTGTTSQNKTTYPADRPQITILNLDKKEF